MGHIFLLLHMPSNFWLDIVFVDGLDFVDFLKIVLKFDR